MKSERLKTSRNYDSKAGVYTYNLAPIQRGERVEKHLILQIRVNYKEGLSSRLYRLFVNGEIIPRTLEIHKFQQW